MLEQRLDVEVLQLSDDEAEDVVLGRLKLIDNLLFSLLDNVRSAPISLNVVTLKDFLNVCLDIGLFETAAVKLSLYVFHLFGALLLPVELVVDVSGSRSNRQVPIRQLHNVLRDDLFINAAQLWVEAEVFRNLLIGQLDQCLNIVARKRGLVRHLCCDDCLCNVLVVNDVHGTLLCLFFSPFLLSFLLGFLSGGYDLLCKAHLLNLIYKNLS